MQNKGMKMKKYLVVLVFLVINATLSAKESGYSLNTALVGMSMDYREYDDSDKLLDSEKSALNEMPGVEFKLVYTKVLESKNYAQLGAKFMLLNGETEYVGAYIGSGLGYGSLVSRTKNMILDTDIDYMFTHVYGNGLEFSYGAGIGYRSWRRELSPSQVEIYTWLSVRPKIGLAYSKKFFYMGILAEYQYGINPKMSINNPDVEVNLGGADIIQIHIPIVFSINDSLDVSVETVIERQNIGKSDSAYFTDGTSTYEIWEPKSTAYNNYLKVGATFKF